MQYEAEDYESHWMNFSIFKNFFSAAPPSSCEDVNNFANGF